LTPFGNTGTQNAKTTDVSTSGNFSLTYDNNVCQDETVTATFGGTGFTGTRTIQIQKLVGGEWEQVFQQASASTGAIANLGILPVGVHTFRWKVSGPNGPNNIVFTVTVLQCGCEDEFSAVLNCTNPNAKTLTVTFTAENAGDYVIQGGLTSGAIIGSAVATADFIRNTSHRSAGGPSNVTRWEGSLDDCETVTVTITYSGGSGVGDWSAKSKVDGVEVVNGQSVDQACN
jgi:hypothetical protein